MAVLKTLADLGSGFDIVSGGELAKVLSLNVDPQKIIFSGVGKTATEIRQALEAGIGSLNVESAAELAMIQALASELDVLAPISIRVNPDVDAQTHPYIATGLKASKFGIAIEEAPALYRQAASYSHCRIIGVDCHIGSQIEQLTPFLLALDSLLDLIDTLHADGIEIEHLNLSGGLGVPYTSETPPHPSDYAQAIFERLHQRRPDLPIILEPGRAIAANAGIFVTQVLYLKPTATKNFAIVDGGMNDFLRPALYQATHDIVAVKPRDSEPTLTYDIVGPVCESADCFGSARSLALQPDDLLAIRGAGAYGYVMSSHYNARPRPAEVMVDGDQFQLITPRY